MLRLPCLLLVYDIDPFFFFVSYCLAVVPDSLCSEERFKIDPS